VQDSQRRDGRAECRAPWRPADEASWQANHSEFTDAAKLSHKLCLEKVGPTAIDFSAKSYISLKKGKRAWWPMWPRQDGYYVYIPGGPGGAEDQPSDLYAQVKDNLADLGIEPAWSFKYNGGAKAPSPARHKSTLSILYR
jgi:hypothetical protein